MKSTLSLITLSWTLCCTPPLALAQPLPSVPPEKAGLSAARLVKIDEIAEGLIEKKRLAGCVIAVARNGQLAYLTKPLANATSPRARRWRRIPSSASTP